MIDAIQARAVIDEYREAHKRDRRLIEELQRENFEIKCELAETRGDVDHLTKLLGRF